MIIVLLQENGLLRRMAPVQASAMGWPAAALGLTTTPVVKRVIRLDVPLNKFPNVSADFYFIPFSVIHSFILFLWFIFFFPL